MTRVSRQFNWNIYYLERFELIISITYFLGVVGIGVVGGLSSSGFDRGGGGGGGGV